jgi:hypothetical protein
MKGKGSQPDESNNLITDFASASERKRSHLRDDVHLRPHRLQLGLVVLRLFLASIVSLAGRGLVGQSTDQGN